MMRYSIRTISLLVVLLSSLLVAVPARANVDLGYFTVEQGPSQTQLLVSWGTETETDTAAFIIRRGDTADPARATDIQTIRATGTAARGDDYEYLDSGLTAGQVYYYWLIEFTTGGDRNELGTVQQATAGATPTPTATTQPTATSPTATATTQPAATSPAPTSTPQPTTTQPVPQQGQTPAATATPRAQVENSAAATNTPAAAANLAATAPAAVPVATDAQAVEGAATSVAPDAERSEGTDALPATADVTPAAESQDAAGVEQLSGETAEPTATAQAVAEAPGAAPQAPLVRPTATPRPDDSSSEGGDTSSLLLVIGGGSVCGAALLALVVFFVWRRR